MDKVWGAQTGIELELSSNGKHDICSMFNKFIRANFEETLFEIQRTVL